MFTIFCPIIITFFPLLFSHSSAVLDKFSTFLPVIATSAPSLQNNMAVPAPIPELAPENKISLSCGLVSCYRGQSPHIG